MGKRSNFERVERDFYPTPKEAVIPLLPHLVPNSTFAEPCCGTYDLVDHLETEHECVWASDIHDHDMFGMDAIKDALTLTEQDLRDADYIITNPPWDRKILHLMIDHFRKLRPTWLLFDADWIHTKQSKEFMPYCRMIVSVGRVKWIPDSKMTGKDNCCWHLFDKDVGNQTIFIGR